MTDVGKLAEALEEAWAGLDLGNLDEYQAQVIAIRMRQLLDVALPPPEPPKPLPLPPPGTHWQSDADAGLGQGAWRWLMCDRCCALMGLAQEVTLYYSLMGGPGDHNASGNHDDSSYGAMRFICDCAEEDRPVVPGDFDYESV